MRRKLPKRRGREIARSGGGELVPAQRRLRSQTPGIGRRDVHEHHPTPRHWCVTQRGFGRHREPQRAHEIANDRRSLRPLELPVLLPCIDALLKLRRETARLDETITARGAVHAMQLAA